MPRRIQRPKDHIKRIKVLGRCIEKTWKHRHRHLDYFNITYDQYLKSDHWKELKLRKWDEERRHRVCWLCSKSWRKVGLELHHRTYRHMGCELLSDVAWLCRECHQAVHDYYKK